MFLFHLRLGL
jgi:hypothetical protein